MLSYPAWAVECEGQNSAHFVEFIIDSILADQSAQSQFLMKYKDSASVAMTERYKFLVKNEFEDQISDEQLISFLYDNRRERNVVSQAERLKLFDNYEKSFSNPSDFEDIEDWYGFWRGVKIFEKRSSKKLQEVLSAKLELTFSDSEIIYRWFSGLEYNRKQECLWCVALNNKNQLISYREITRGIVNQTIAHPREIFAFAIRNTASAIVLIHNHPSGDPFPSVSDIESTDRLKHSGQILGIKVLDHLIIGLNSYYSFNDGVSKMKILKP